MGLDFLLHYLTLNVFLLVLLGFVTGIISGLLGIGGGELMVPGLIFILALIEKEAQATSFAL